jgi:hypothetical protein
MMMMMIMSDYRTVLNLIGDNDYYVDIVKEDDDLLMNKLVAVATAIVVLQMTVECDEIEMMMLDLLHKLILDNSISVISKKNRKETKIYISVIQHLFFVYR